MTTDERFSRIEGILDRLADRQQQTDETVSTLLDSHIKLTEAQARLTEAQAQTETQIRALGLAVESVERQWQAYLTTIRPQ